MNYSIPDVPPRVIPLQSRPNNEELVASAIAGIIHITRCQGRSLEDLVTELLAEDLLLEKSQRQRLSEVVARAWEKLP
ncbi:MAG: hypothetical protein EBV05_08095 [Cyanobacteria bacterium WB6_1B_304]|jgi:hypothetical protein|nr:hypothetical protein [Cyanobacteria bacterium WB6_1B_304]